MVHLARGEHFFAIAYRTTHLGAALRDLLGGMLRNTYRVHCGVVGSDCKYLCKVRAEFAGERRPANGEKTAFQFDGPGLPILIRVVRCPL